MDFLISNWSTMRAWLVAAGIVAALSLLTAAQDDSLPSATDSVYDVFVVASDANEADELVFVHILSGEATTLRLHGDRYTLLADGVLYADAATSGVRFARPTGAIGEHDFIRANADAARVDWVVSRDGARIAWTLTRRSDADTLVTSTVVANADGSDLRGLLSDGPRAGIRVMPAAFGMAGSQLYLDLQPEGISQHLPYRHFAALVAIDLEGGGLRQLADDTACFCPAGFGERVMLRILPDMAVQLVDLADGAVRTIDSVAPDGYAIAGAPIISSDDSLAVYPISRIDADSSESRFALVNLEDSSQALLGEAIADLVFPLAFSEDDSALLFLRGDKNETWKLRLSDGSVTRVAAGVYLGRLGA